MAVKFRLDTILIEGKDYTTPKRRALIIRKKGTDGDTDTQLLIDDKPTGVIKELVSPLHVRSTNKLGPLQLGALLNVVPPETNVMVEGPTGAKVRIIGEWLFLAPGEAMPGDLMTRYEAQFDHWLTFKEATYSHGTDKALVVDAEVEVLEVKPLATEEYLFAHPVMASVANYTPAEGDLAVRFYLDNKPLDDLLEKTKVGPVDLLSCPRPPKDDTDEVPLSLCDTPIRVPGDHVLSIRVRNTKGADITPPTGTSLDFTITAICEFKRVG